MDYDGIKLCEICGEYTTGRLCRNCQWQEMIDNAPPPDGGRFERELTDDEIDQMTDDEVNDAIDEELADGEPDEWEDYHSGSGLSEY